MRTPDTLPRRCHLRWTLPLLLAVVGLTGCSTTPGGLGPLATLKEAQTQAEVQRMAANDPFPSPRDVGLGSQ